MDCTKDLQRKASDALCILNKEKREIMTSREYRLGVMMTRAISTIKQMDVKQIRYYWNRYTVRRKQKKYNKPNHIFLTWDDSIETDSRVLIYTCVTGGYESLIEPLFLPDHVDYIAVTDMEIPSSSRWKKMDINLIDEIRGLSDVEKSRYPKICPHKLFPQYEYSIYLDANFRVVADVSQFIKCVGSVPFASNWHPERNSIFDEAEACILAKKGQPDLIRKQMEYYRSQGMPDNYGLIHCNMLIRKHNEPQIMKLMEDWWKEFLLWSKRDQISLPFVLWKNGYGMKDIGFVGKNVEENPAIELFPHDKRYREGK